MGPFVQRVNATQLGNQVDLASFLFGQERACLEAYRPILVDLQRGKCLYCGEALSKQSQVDHFIPWSRYPADIGQNFVLAHATCNNAKSDHLAAEQHLFAWMGRNREYGTTLSEKLFEAGLPSDPLAHAQVARWIYEQTEKADGQVWVERKILEHLSPRWSACFAA